MTERKMTPKGFMSKIGSAKSAIAFLKEHRDYLVTGELSEITSPIVAKYEAGAVLATPTLSDLRDAVWSHIKATETAKAEKSLSRKAPEEKPYLASVLDPIGQIVYRTNDNGELVEITKGFDSYVDAERWLDRQLVEHAGPNDHGEVIWALCPEKLESLKVRTVSRDDAMARVFRSKGGPVTKKPASPGALSSRMRVNESHAKFSAG